MPSALGHLVKSLHLLAPLLCRAPNYLTAIYHTALSLGFLQGYPLGHCSYISADSLQLPVGCQGRALCSMGTKDLVLSFLSLTPLPHSSTLEEQALDISLEINSRYRRSQPFLSSHC